MVTLLVQAVFDVQTSTQLLQICDTEPQNVSHKKGGNETVGCVCCIKHATST